jgi:hypothetical protein
MFRTLMAVLALAALLASAACNDIAGPAADQNPTNVGGSGGGDRTPQEFESPDLLVPEDPGSGNGSGDDEDVLTPNRLGERRDRHEVSPGDDNGGGGDESWLVTSHPRRRGNGQVSPTP